MSFASGRSESSSNPKSVTAHWSLACISMLAGFSLFRGTSPMEAVVSFGSGPYYH
jgi:hypothetical protein